MASHLGLIEFQMMVAGASEQNDNSTAVVIGFVVGAIAGYALPGHNARSTFDVGTSLREPGEAPSTGVKVFLAWIHRVADSVERVASTKKAS
jgi:hypothetical protein